METRGATLAQLESAARTARVRFGQGRWDGGHRAPAPKPLNGKGDRFAFTLRTDPAHPMAGHPKAPPVWTRRAQGSGSVLGGKVCWHGHRAFMAALFALAPDATLRSAFATYRGAAGFRSAHGATADRNVGSQVRPVSYADACTCADTVETGPRGGLRLAPGFQGSDPPEWKTQRAARKARSLTPPGHLRAVSIETATQQFPDGDLTA